MEQKLSQDRYSQAIKKLREMKKNKISTDVLIQCKGGFIHAHRCILMANNAFFYKMFTTHLVGDNVIQIEFDNVNVEVMEIIVNSIYGDLPSTFKNNVDAVIEVLDTCNVIEETFLFDYCTNLLMNLLSVENCVDFWNIMTKYQINKMEKQIMLFVLRNLPDLLKSGKLMHISSILLGTLISFAAETSQLGDDLLPLVVEWGKKNPMERLDELVPLFTILSQLTFTADCTINFIKFDWFVKSSPELMSCFYSLLPHSGASISQQMECKANEVDSLQPTSHISCVTSSAVTPSIRTDSALSGAIVEYSKNIVSARVEKNIFERDQKLKLLFNFYSKVNAQHLEIFTQTYNTFEDKWYEMREVKLPCSLSTNWYPMTSVCGDAYYFAISNDKHFVAYKEKSDQTYYGPAVKFQCRVTGIAEGKLMYIWNYESIVQFNSVTAEWKVLSPIRNVLAASNLLGVNGNLYFHAAFPPAILKYDFERDEWIFKKCFREKSAIKSIKCRCLNANCKKKLYFVANDKKLLSYDTVTDSWAGKMIPELKCSLPLLMNCDESLILFGDKHDEFNYFVYYPIENKWSSFKNKQISWKDLRCVACDISLLQH